MRKSLAPSSRGINVRPLGNPSETNVQSSCIGGTSETVRSTVSILNLLKENADSTSCNDVQCQQPTVVSYTANSCSNTLPVSHCKQPLTNAFKNIDHGESVHMLPSTNEVVSVKRKFNVVWGKLSKKKHKKWEGDGVAEIGPNSVILKDCDGKVLGSTRGVKTDELEEGSRVIVGGKEIELIDPILDNGKEEEMVAEVNYIRKPQMPAADVRPAKRPRLLFSKTFKGSSDESRDSLIMPVPPSEHQQMSLADPTDDDALIDEVLNI